MGICNRFTSVPFANYLAHRRRYFEPAPVVRDAAPAVNLEYRSAKRILGEICVTERHSYSHGYKYGFSEGLRRSLTLITGRTVRE